MVHLLLERAVLQFLSFADSLRLFVCGHLLLLYLRLLQELVDLPVGQVQQLAAHLLLVHQSDGGVARQALEARHALQACL